MEPDADLMFVLMLLGIFPKKEIKKLNQDKHSAKRQIHVFQVRMDNRRLTVNMT